MDQLTERQIRQHVLIIGWLHITLNIFTLLMAVVIFAFLASLGPLIGDAEATRILSLVALVASLFLAMIALPGIFAGIGLLKGTSWGRILTIIVGILGLINFPVGTAVGIYTLWILLKDETVDFLAHKQAQAAATMPRLSTVAGS